MRTPGGVVPRQVLRLDPAYTLGFLGISYTTFRSLDVIINVQDGLLTSIDPVQYLAFLLFFPTISAGPIDRYRRFGLDWNHNRTHTSCCKIGMGPCSDSFEVFSTNSSSPH